MLTAHRQYILPGERGLHADVTVIPTGELEVNFEENDNSLKADFDELYFYSDGKKTELVCRDQLGSDSIRWHLYLACNDARELETLIESAEEEYETLMRDL